MAIYKAIASTKWSVSTTWNEWDGANWVTPFTSPLYPNSTSDTVYLNTFIPIIDIPTVTTGIISNAASTGYPTNAAAGGRLSLTVADTPATTTIKASNQFVYASTTGATSTQGLIDASAKSGFTLTIDSVAVLNQVAAPLFTAGTGCTVTIKNIATLSLSGAAGSKLFNSVTTQNLTLDAVTVVAANSNVIDLQTASNYFVTVTNNSALTGSTSGTITVPFYALRFETGSGHTCVIEGSTITSGTGNAAIFMSPAGSNIVKIKNDIVSPTSSAKIVNVNDVNAIIAYKIQIDNNITGWDFQPASTAGTTTLSPVAGVYPLPANVLAGVSYGASQTGTLTQADPATVLAGTSYGVVSSVNSTNRVGTLDIPNAVAQVVGNIVANLT